MFESYVAVKQVINALPHNGDSVDVSPRTIYELKEIAKSNPQLMSNILTATTPSPLRPALTRAVVDSWSMTSLEEHTGRPDIEPWLRGWIENDKPQTVVIWRRYLPIRRGEKPSADDVEEFFEAATPYSSEILETESYRVAKV